MATSVLYLIAKMPTRGRLSQLQRLILSVAFAHGKDGQKLPHWPLLFLIAQRYKFSGVAKWSRWGSEGFSYGKVMVYGRAKKKYQYIDDAFQVSFHRSVRNLEDKGLVRSWGAALGKTTHLQLTHRGIDLARELNVKVTSPRQGEALAEIPIFTPQNKRPSVAKVIAMEIARTTAKS